MYPANRVRRISLGWSLRAALITMLICPSAATALQTDIDGLRVQASPGKTRIVFDLGRPVDYKWFFLTDRLPLRLVVDFSSARLNADVSNLELKKTPILKVRTGKRNNGEDVRVVLELNEEVRLTHFELPPIMQYGDRLVIDLHVKDRPSLAVSVKSQRPLKQMRDVVIAIDAGHGGDDPGAVGPGELYEKTVVLEIAKKLFVLFERERGYKPKLIREGDYYVALRARSELAHDIKADVFLSIHADAFKTPKVSGASVYALTIKGSATSVENLLREERENRADLLGGVGSLDKYEAVPHLARALADMTAQASLSQSLEMGNSVLSHLKKINKLHKKTVEQAGFAVLKKLDMPSLLIETGYISNPAEARKLATGSHQAKLAKAIFDGVTASMESSPPFGSYLAWVKRGNREDATTYVIKRGDTLSEIAARYRVSFKKLKDFNGLGDDTIHIGQTLKIPPR